MQRLWHDIRTHRLAVALFGLYWLATAIIIVVLWRQGVPHNVWWVPHAVMAISAGALVAWWRNAEIDALGVSAAAGALVGALNLGVQEMAFAVERWLANSPPAVVAAPAGEEEPGWVFIVVLTIIICVIGGLLGALGWVVTVIFMPVARRLRAWGGPAAPTGVA